MKIHKLATPLSSEKLNLLKAGDKILLSGTIYTARDAAHKKLVTAISNNEKLPFDLAGQVIYYVGPAPAPPGRAIGSAGPTTSYRMDDLTEPLLKKGLKAMIGKGQRAEFIRDYCRKFNSVYLLAIGGAAVVYAKSITKSEIIAYPELGAEAVRKLEVRDFPCFVAYDVFGNSIFSS